MSRIKVFSTEMYTALKSPLVEPIKKSGIHHSEFYAHLRNRYFLQKKRWFFYFLGQTALEYYLTKFTQAYNLLELIELTAEASETEKNLKLFLKMCQAHPDILLISDPLHETTILEAYLEKLSLLKPAFYILYMQIFRSVLSLVPTLRFEGWSAFDCQDAFGFNLLFHIVNTKNHILIETYLQHPRVKVLMNYNFVDHTSLFNIFCLVYSRFDERKQTVGTMNELSVILTQNGIRFSIDHLLGVLRHVIPISKEGTTSIQLLSQAIEDFYIFRKGRVLTALQYKTLNAEIGKIPALAAENKVQRILLKMAPKLEMTTEKIISAELPFFVSRSRRAAYSSESLAELK